MALQANSDPALIALAHFKNLEVGKHYTFATDPLKVYKFESIEVPPQLCFYTNHFLVPLRRLEVEHKDLKGLRAREKSVPSLQPAATLTALQPSVCLMAEFGRAKAQHWLYQKYHEHLGMILVKFYLLW